MHAMCAMCRVQVDFEAPKDYKEPVRASPPPRAAAEGAAASTSAVGADRGPAPPPRRAVLC